ncbi:hypothetical protein ONE63_009556 [Megalurothrips usitatus]|uniref:VWFA domain-containing protein n=1 Tax=Megalurothrips usitatus TaxID=439358 RepID=A0AAV7XP46_9NEOP|nr:hypothetical protein ONE63_009556 [Megalurothrips usitatus]
MRCAVAVLLACASACTVAGPPTTPTTGTSSTFAPGSCGKHFSICGDGDSISVFQSEPCDDYETSVNVQIQSLHVDTIIQARYALTKMTSVVKNGENSFHTFNFTFVVPESAKISEIILNENSYYYTSTATEREVGTPSVTDVGVSVREATRIVVRLSLDPLAEVKLILKYEELLIRRLSKYTYKVHLEPGEVVPDLQVNVQIREPVNLGFAETHAFTNDVNTAKENTATTTFTNGDADIFYNPSITEQIETATSFGGNPMSGLKGYLSVSYDVDRGSQGGELYVHENWFVHFFAPALSGPIAKHALFVLDVSGSMAGKKIEQLKSALSSILSNLRDSDIFTVIEFSSTITVWNLDGIDDSSCHSYAATNSRITAAQTRARRMTASGGTSMKTGLLTGLQCAKLIQSNKVDPILVVLTDGQPTDGTPDVVINAVTASNTYNTHIFSLAFGKDANVNFLRRLSNNNGGEAHVIYEGDDAESQLEDFYRSISTPLLLNVAVEYDEDYVRFDWKGSFI